MHIEGLIVAADKMFRMERFDEAYEIIEKCIANVQYFAHPCFNLTDINVRLEYKYFENRMFHILLLKYAYMTSNMACHRTALELVKLLLNLDPSDPLGVTLIMDSLALRANEYQWLIQAISFISVKMNLGYMYNIQFSNALAYFHQSRKGREEMEYADKLLQDALSTYPWALQPLTEHIKSRETTLRSHEFYNQFANDTTGDVLKKLLKFYAAFTAPRWREPEVMEWLLRNARAVTKNINNVQHLKLYTSMQFRRHRFDDLPLNFYRHFAVISSMEKFINGGAVPGVQVYYSYNPFPPPDSTSRSGYEML